MTNGYLFSADVIRYADGCRIWPSTAIKGKWMACWADRTPLRGDNDETSYFASAEEAAAALAEGGEGPAKGSAHAR